MKKIIKQEYYGMVEIDWTSEKIEIIKTRLMSFFNTTGCYSGESVTQTNRGNIGSVEVMSEIANVLFKDIKIEY